MDTDKSLWFASGLVLGLLLGAGTVGGIGWKQLEEARAETEKERATVRSYEEAAQELLQRAYERLREAENERRKFQERERKEAEEALQKREKDHPEKQDR